MWLNELRQRWLDRPRTTRRHRHTAHRPRVRLRVESLECRTLLSVGPVLTPLTLPADTINIAYNQTITASEGMAPVTLAVSNIQDAIPGLNVPLTSSSNTLTINGTPTLAGTETFTVTATDSKGNHQSANYSITVNPALSFSPASLTLPADTVNVAYSQTITANGGTPGVNVAVSNVQVNGVAGPGISGLTLIPTGNTLAIGGTPTFTGTTAETETFTVTATDSVDATTNATYSITVNPAITLSPATLPAGMQARPYSQTIAASGGTGTLTLTVSAIQNQISGLTVPTSGTGDLAISGMPTGAEWRPSQLLPPTPLVRCECHLQHHGQPGGFYFAGGQCGGSDRRHYVVQSEPRNERDHPGY